MSKRRQKTLTLTLNEAGGAFVEAKYVPITKAAQMLGVSIDTLRRWDKRGLVASVRPSGTTRYFAVQDVKKIIKEGTPKPSAPIVATKKPVAIKPVKARKSAERYANAKTEATPMQPQQFNPVTGKSIFLYMASLTAIFAAVVLVLFWRIPSNVSKQQPVAGTKFGSGLSEENGMLSVDAKIIGTTNTTATNSGLEVTSEGVRILGGCKDGQILKWNATTMNWECQADTAGNSTTTTNTSVGLNLSLSDQSTNQSNISNVQLGPTTASNEQFLLISPQNGQARLELGSQVALLNKNQTVTGSWAFNNISCSDCINLGSETSGNYVETITTSPGLSGGVAAEGSNPILALDVTTSGVTGNISSNSGLEIASDGLRLIGGCSDTQLLKFNATGLAWECASDVGGTGGTITVAESDGAPTVGGTSTLQFGPAANSSDEFIVTNQGAGSTRVRLGSTVLLTTNFSATLDPIYVNAGEAPATGDITGTFSGGLNVGANSVALGTDTTGNYVATITNGNGISGSSAVEGGVPTIALGNLTADWVQSGAFDVVLNNSSSELKILESVGGTFYGIFDIGDLSADQTFTFSQGGTVITSSNINSNAVTSVSADAGLTGGGGPGAISLTVGAGAGITVNANDIAVIYGSGANNAAAGSNTFTCASGSGNLTGGGTVVTIGTSGTSCGAITTNAAVSFGTSVTTPLLQNTGALNISTNTSVGADDIIFNTAGTEKLRILEGGNLLFEKGANDVTFAVDTPGAAATYTFGGVTGTVLTTGNYSGSLDGVYVNVGESPAAADIGGSFSAGLTVNANSVALATDTVGDYVASFTAGNGLTGSATGEGSTPTLAVVSANGAIVANADSIALTLIASADALSSTTSSASGLEVLASGLTLIQGCGDAQVLKWNETTDTWGCAADATGALTTFDSIGDPTGNGSIAMGETIQSFDWNTNNVTAAAFDGLTISVTNDATTDTNTQRGLVVKNNSAIGGTTETLFRLENADDSAVTNAIQFVNGTGGFTNLFDINGTLISGSEFTVLDAGIALGTETTGSYVANIGTVTGLTLGGTSGAGGVPTLAVIYGSGANNAAAGANTFTCSSGSGNLTGGGTTVTIGTSGTTCAAITTNAAVSFGTSVTTPLLQNTGSLTISANTSAGADDIIFSTVGTEKLRVLESGDLLFEKGTNDVTFTVATPGAAATYTFSGVTGTVLTTGNYAGNLDSIYVNVGESPAAGDITGSFSAGLTVAANSVALTTDTTGDYVASFTAGNGLTGNATGEGSTPTLAVVSANGAIVANADNIALTLISSADALSATTSSASGLETVATGLTLIQGCSDTQILKWNETLDTWGCAADATGGSTTFDTIGDPAANGSIAMAEFAQSFDWNTNNVTAAAFDGLTISVTNDATTDTNTQRGLVVKNNSATGGTTETLVVIDNADNSAVTTGLQIVGSSTGAITTAIDLSDAEIGVAIALGANDITGSVFAVTGATGNVTTGTITSGLINGQTINSTANFTGSLSVATTLGVTGATTLSSTLAVTGTSTYTGLGTFNGGLTVELGDTFTFNGDAFTDLTGTGLTISAGALQTTLGTSVQNGEVDDDLTISSTGSVDWLALTNYPAACSAGSAVSTLADVPTCTAFAPGTAGSYIQNGTAAQNTANFNIQSVGTTSVTAKFRAIASQTADIIQVRDATDATTVFAVSPAGNLTSGTITSGLINGQTINSTANFTGSLAVATTLGVTGATTLGSTVGITGAATLSSTLSVSGTSTVVAINASGAYTQTGAGANTFTGSSSFTSAGTGLAVTNNATVGGTLAITGASTYTGLATFNGGLTIEATDTFTFNTDAFTDLTGTGLTISAGALQTTLGTSVQNSEVDDDLTISSTGSVDWLALTNYPAACAAGSAVSTLADVPTCTAFNTDTSITLQDAYNATSGNSITTTDARDISFTLANTTTDSNFTISTATDSTGFVSLTRADGAGTASPAQLLLVDNLDINLALAIGIKLQSAAGGLTTAIDLSDAEIVTAIALGANDITGTFFSVLGASGNLTSGTITSGLINGQTITATASFTGSLTVATTLGVTGATSLSSTLAVTGNSTLTGDIAVNGGDITSTGALNITPGGALVVGATGQNATLQGAITTITSTGATNDIVLTSADQIRLTGFNCSALTNGGALTTDASGNIICSNDDGGGAASTLQDTYGNDIDGSDSIIALSTADDSIIFRNPASVGTDSGYILMLDQLNTGAIDNLRVNNAGTGYFLDLTATGTGTTAAGVRIRNTSTGVITTAIDVSDAEIVTALAIGDNAITGTNFNVTSSGTVSIAAGTNTESALNIGRGWASSIKINPSVTGIIINESYTTAATQTGALTGLALDFNTNFTGFQGGAITGVDLSFPGLSVTSSVTNYTGFNIGAATSLVTNPGTINWNGASFTMPNITQTSGTITSNGLKVTTGTITTGGIQNALNIMAQGASAGTLSGINFGSITPGAGTENSIIFGSGWDTNITTTAGVALNIDSGTTGSINIGTGTGGKAITIGNSVNTVTITGNSSSVFVIDAVTVSAVEFNRLDGKDAALVDQNDFISTDGAGATSNGSGLEAGTGGIGLLQGCSDGQILKWVDGTSVWNCAADGGISDSRLKQNVNTIGSALDTINKLNAVSYTFNDLYSDVAHDDTDTGLHYGFIAQEVQKILPDLVGERFGIGNYLGIDYQSFSGILTSAIQELDQKVDTNAAFASGGLQTLDQRVSDLEYRVSQIEYNGSTSTSSNTVILKDGQSFLVQDDNGKALASVDAQGNARFSGLLSANGKDIDLSNLSVGALAVNLDLIANGAMVVNGPATFKEAVRFQKDAIFDGNIAVNGIASFNNNAAGLAKIAVGEQRIRIVFSKPYATVPVITISLGDGKFATYSYRDVTEAGFEIILKDPATEDLNFSWIATSVNDVKTVTSASP